MNREYYRVTGGHAQEAVDKFEEKFRKVAQLRQDMCNELGATGIYSTKYQVLGFQFSTPPGEGWLPVEGEKNVHKPNGRTRTGKPIARKMKTLPHFPGAMSFSCLLGTPEAFSKGVMHCAVYERIGDALILSVPVAEGEEPPVIDGAELLKKSEYWTLKEEAANDQSV